MIDGTCPPQNASAARRAVQRQLLSSLRETLANATPVMDGIAAPPADRAALDATRARIALALSQVERISAALAEPVAATADDPAAIAAAVALAERIALDRLGWKQPRTGK